MGTSPIFSLRRKLFAKFFCLGVTSCPAVLLLARG